MTLQIAMVIPDRLPEVIYRNISRVEAARGEGNGFAEGGEDWDQRDPGAVRMMRTPTSVKSKRPPQLAALICFSLGGLICGAGPVTTGDDLSSHDLSSDDLSSEA
jgi:hypothetical protein